jgi:hypothetical protein
MLLSLAPRENKKESHCKVSEKDLIDEAKVVTIGSKRLTKGKANLFRSFDNFSHGSAAELVKDLRTKSDFAFFDKRGKRLCLQDKVPLQAVLDLLGRHKRKSKKKKIVHDMKPKDAAKQKHKLSQQQPTNVKNRSRKQLDDM